MDIYRVIWKADDVILSGEPAVRSEPDATRPRIKIPVSVFHIEVARERDQINVSAYEELAGESKTVRQYEEIPAPLDLIHSRCTEIVCILNKVNREGRISPDVLFKLRETGRTFFRDLLPANVRNRLIITQADHLCINMDDQLVHIPWELLHDGKQFLCQRFCMGRLVKTRQNVISRVQARPLTSPVKALILSERKGNLKEAYAEAVALRNFMDQRKELVNVTFRDDGLSPDFIKEKISNFDMVHYAGHSEYDALNPEQSGWRLATGNFTAGDIMNMPETAIMPAFIFSNACQTARTAEWTLDEKFQNKVFGMANAFILTGVKHYIGTFWEVLDEPSNRFALEFYKHLFDGKTVGQAIRDARLELISVYGEETILWASYLLYGDPSTIYMEQIKKTEIRQGDKPAEIVAETRSEPRKPADQEGAGRPSHHLIPGKINTYLTAGIIALAILVAVLIAYSFFNRNDTASIKNSLVTYYRQGDFDNALKVSATLEKLDADVRLTYVVRGNILLREGNLDEAEKAWQQAVSAAKGTGMQKAEAFLGLGRIASIRKQSDTALAYYKKAADADPNAGQSYISQAVIYQNRGKFGDAVELLAKAKNLNQDNDTVVAMILESRKQLELEKDQKKQEQIDLLVQELIKSMKSTPIAIPSDEWTSLPLSVWVMDFDVAGYSLLEGEEQLLISGIQHHLSDGSRIQLVERAVLDKLLKELKLGSSEMADQRTALALGKILAARILIAGSITYAGSEKQISLRMIETETGRIITTVSESFPSVADAYVISEKLAKALSAKIEKAYPVRGVIEGVSGEQITLNIGQNTGVQTGQKFSIAGTDEIVEITSVRPHNALAKVSSGNTPPAKGLRVEQVR
jgi:tetratricopeptide (TPR) repeat protein